MNKLRFVHLTIALLGLVMVFMASCSTAEPENARTITPNDLAVAAEVPAEQATPPLEESQPQTQEVVDNSASTAKANQSEDVQTRMFANDPLIQKVVIMTLPSNIKTGYLITKTGERMDLPPQLANRAMEQSGAEIANAVGLQKPPSNMS